MNTSMIVLGMFGLGGPELIIVAIVVLLLFGGKKIPQLMKGLGQGINEFKKSSKGISDTPDTKNTDTVSEK